MLSAFIVTVLTFGMFTRPAQAELLDPVTKTVGCLLNIASCDPPTTTGGDDTGTGTPDPGNTGGDPTGSGDTTPPDTAAPTATVSATPDPAGGSSNVVTISGTLSDDKNLASYSITINGTDAQSTTSVTGTSANVSYAWNLSDPNRVASATYTIAIHVTDQAGNSNDATTTVQVDNDGPDVTVSGGDVIIKSGSISPDVTASDAHAIGSYSWTEDADNPASLSFDHSAAEPTFTPSVEGSYTFYLTVSDGLGNVTTKPFTFGYAKQLETVPLPTTTDPTNNLVDQSPSTIAIIPTVTTPTARSGRDETAAADTPEVLGSTVTAPGQIPPTTNVATIAPTKGGWSVFGVLRYWWIVVIGILFAAWLAIKKFVVARIPEHS